MLRTVRGVELGMVIRPHFGNSSAEVGADRISENSFDGTILRRCSPEDRLLSKKLNESAHEAYLACRAYLEQNQSADSLLDVEALLDAKTLYFYFLGTPSSELSQELEKLVSIFQESVRSSQFAKLLEDGCGPAAKRKRKERAGPGEAVPCALSRALARNSVTCHEGSR